MSTTSALPGPEGRSRSCSAPARPWQSWKTRAAHLDPRDRARDGLGLLLGAWVVDFGTSWADLALVGGLTGLVLGPFQALALPTRAERRWSWALAMPAMWALGWTATTLGGIHVEEQFTIFGMYGALAFSAVSGVLLHRLLPYRESPPTLLAALEAPTVAG